MAVPVSEDEIIRRRLLIEGEGGIDDRRINTLLRNFLKWCNSTESPEESNATYQKLLIALSLCEHSVQTSYQVYQMNLEEQENYQKLNDQIELNIKGAYEKITEGRKELQEAKRIRKNRQEYDALAKVILQHPDRTDMLKQLESLDKELDSLKENQKELEQKLELRKKQFHVLISAIHEMQLILENDEPASSEQPAESEMEVS